MALASLATVALLALAPAGAFAQDAGSQQYQDPLAGNPENGNGNGSGNGSGNAGNSGAGTSPATQTAQADGQAADDGLPRTGLDAWLLVIAGTALLGGGFALRRVADRTGA